jgi:NADH:ubiquinone oxidoreductase subunit E
MGSSCFSRGNAENAEFIQRYVDKHNLQDAVETSGCLCRNGCKNGPNIEIDGKVIPHVTPEALPELLAQTLGYG